MKIETELERKEYNRARMKVYYANNKEEKLKKNKKYYDENRDKILTQKRSYYNDNKDQVLKKNKLNYKDNRDKYLTQRRTSYQDNKEEILTKDRIYKATDAGKVVKARAAAKRKQSLGYSPLNKRFKGSEGHHIDNTLVLFIPQELHRAHMHNHKDQDSMNTINALAFEWLCTQELL